MASAGSLSMIGRPSGIGNVLSQSAIMDWTGIEKCAVFQVHGVDETGATALRKRLHRKQMAPFFSKLPRCLIAMEACGTAHYWARTLAAMGHEVRLIPPSYVKAYIQRGNAAA